VDIHYAMRFGADADRVGDAAALARLVERFCAAL
jgi:hypothetical protein